MKGFVKIHKEKMTPTQRVMFTELEELYEEGSDYFKESNSYMLWHIFFYIAGIGSFIADLYLPAGFALFVAFFAFIQHIRYRTKAKRTALKIMKLEEDLFKNAIKEATKAFENMINGKD